VPAVCAMALEIPHPKKYSSKNISLDVFIIYCLVKFLPKPILVHSLNKFQEQTYFKANRMVVINSAQMCHKFVKLLFYCHYSSI